jgi:hypothetical protein
MPEMGRVEQSNEPSQQLGSNVGTDGAAGADVELNSLRPAVEGPLS